MAAPDGLRENSLLQEEQRRGWSAWTRAMVPPDSNGRKFNIEPPGSSQAGYASSSDEAALSNLAELCGLYKWKAEGTRPDQPDNVVLYVGGKPHKLVSRINGYIPQVRKSLKKLINEAMAKGYELWVGVNLLRVTGEESNASVGNRMPGCE